jgi:hypothetical protein
MPLEMRSDPNEAAMLRHWIDQPSFGVRIVLMALVYLLRSS